MKKAIIWIFLILFLVFGGVWWWWSSQFSPVNNDKTQVVVVIPKGEGISAIAERLKSENLIRSTLAFKVYVKQNNLSGKIQAGSFKISPSMSLAEVAQALTNGTEDVWIRLQEGWRVEEIAAKLKAELGIEEKVFLEAAKEGYMFPDTYLFPKEATAEYIASTLENTFNQKITDEMKAKFEKQGLSFEEAVNLASIVEREGRSEKVRTEIAGILLKRLNQDMGLNVDASLQYALGYQPSEKSWWKRHLTNEDKKVDSPYNTYIHRGLPPAPICNPSLSSLNAVANADSSTPYLYYYHDSEGNSYYAKTLEEHNRNWANNP